MSNSNFNSKKMPLEDPRYLEMAEKYADKFSEKEAYEDNDVTAWSGIGVFFLHALIWFGSLSTVWYLNVSKSEKIVLSVIVVVIAFVLEWYKSLYMEKFFRAYMKSRDTDMPIGLRKDNQRKKGTAQTVLLAFWGASVVIFMAGGIQYASNNMGDVEKLAYDASLKMSLDAKTKTLETARLSGAGSGRLRQLAEDQTKASDAWQSHKANIDGRQATLNSGGEDSAWNYGLMALAVCLALEFCLFALRGFHEGQQYKVAKSLFSLMHNGTAAGANPSDPSVQMVEKATYDALMQRFSLLDSQFNEYKLHRQGIQQDYASQVTKLETVEKEYADLSTKSKQSSQDLDYAEKRLAANHDIMKLELATSKKQNKELEQKNGYLERLLK